MSTAARLANLGAYTLLPLVGVLLLGWDWREIVLLYWLENVTIGAAMVVRLMRSAYATGGGGDPDTVGTVRINTVRINTVRIDTVRINGRTVEGPAAGAFLAVFFSMHYGLFTLVHGVFVLLLISGIMTPGAAPDTPINWWGALTVALVGGAVQVVLAWRGPLPKLRGMALMFSAYPRIIVLHLTVILGVFAIIALQWGAAAAVLLIALHALIDGATWMLSAARDRRSSRAAQVAEPRG